jgi:O-antigen/teichoic acid export membrane protein
MLVNLYTVRVVLNTLGIEDYGIYHTVAGLVTMFGFLSHSMATASQRYFSFEIGRGNIEQLKKIFSISFTIYALIGFIVFLCAETVGLWFLNHKLIIPIERMNAVQWIYQFSIGSFLCSIMVAPYMAVVIAHEDMSIYAYISIVEVILKLSIVFVLKLILIDKLQLYGILMFVVTALNTTIYRTICRTKYSECSAKFYFEKILFREIISYMGWSLFGSLSGIFRNQGINILLNQFFNPVVVASRSIASSVNGYIASLSQNFSTSIRPQIIKYYASKQEKEMLSLIFRSSRGIFLLMYLFALPFVLEMPMIFTLWLKRIPDHVILFSRLMMIDLLIESINYPIMTAIQATGKIKLYQAVVGCSLMMNLPVSWLLLIAIANTPPYSVILVSVCISIICYIFRLILLNRLIKFSIYQYLKIVIVPVVIIAMLSAIIPMVLLYSLEQNIFRLFVILFASTLSVIIFSYFIGINRQEKSYIKNMISNKIHKMVDFF